MSSDIFVKLARDTVNAIIKGEPLPEASRGDFPQELLEKRAGAFVSIHKNGELRGCIGSILPTQKNLAKEVITQAINASTQDPRFPVVREEELPNLEIKVDVLSEPEQIDSLDDLDPIKYGVIVENDFRRGLLLPDLPGVETVEQQVSIAMQKAGIDQGEPISLYRFTVERHK